MHRKKFLSFLGMAAVAAPIIAKGIPQAETGQSQPLELKAETLQGFAEPLKAVSVDYPLSSGQILVWQGEGWSWTDPVRGKGYSLTNANIEVVWVEQINSWVSLSDWQEFNKAVEEFSDYFDGGENYSTFGFPIPPRKERIDKMVESMLEAVGPNFITIQEKTKGLRGEVSAWKTIKNMSREEAEKKGYMLPHLG